jgi:hypothetical protein
LDDILRCKDLPDHMKITFLYGGMIDEYAMMPATAQRTPKKRGERGMSTQEATWLAWYMCAVSLVLTAFGLYFLVVSHSRMGAPLFDYWQINTVVALTFSPVGAVISPRLPPRNPIGWLFCTIGLIGAVRLFVAEYAIATLLAEPGSTLLSRLPGGEALAWISSWVWVVHFGPFIFLALLFPDGRLPSSRWRPFAGLVALVVAAGTVAVALWPEMAARFDPVSDPLGIEVAMDVINPMETILYALALIAAVSPVVRLRHSKGVERQQVKWFAYAVVMLATSTTLAYVVSEALDVGWLGWVSSILVIVSLVGLPVAMSIAILRYRLYEIDLLINRTLVYGALTATLALIYFGGVAATETTFRALTGQQQQPQRAIVVSTLVIAALFNPLRRRIQGFIDRRFYRSKYDARKSLEAFSAKLRDETDLNALENDLLGVVKETMQPSHVSLWLRPEAAPQREQAGRRAAGNPRR